MSVLSFYRFSLFSPLLVLVLFSFLAFIPLKMVQNLGMFSLGFILLMWIPFIGTTVLYWFLLAKTENLKRLWLLAAYPFVLSLLCFSYLSLGDNQQVLFESASTLFGMVLSYCYVHVTIWGFLRILLEKAQIIHNN